jgi:WD40 repeat protein
MGKVPFAVRLAAAVWCVATLAGLAHPADAKEIDALVQQLGSDKPEERQAAGKRLEVVGEQALPALRKAAAESTDADVRLRAAVLARAIEKARNASVRLFEGHTRQVNQVAFSPDGKHALSGSTDQTMRLWDVATGKEVRRFEGHAGGVWAVAFSPDGKYAGSGGGGTDKDGTWVSNPDPSVRLWDVATGKELRKFDGHTDQVLGVAFTPDGKHLVSASGDRTLRAWEAQGGKELRKLEGHTKGVWGLAVSPDGKRVASGGWDGTVRLWDFESGKELMKFEGHEGWVMSVAFSPDGRRVLSGGADKTARLWDVEGGKELRKFDGHASMVVRVDFSPDGKRALSGSGTQMVGTNRYVPAGSDYVLRLWDLNGGKELRHYEEHTGPVLGVAFSPVGNHALTGSGDRTLRLWALPR